MMEVLLLVLVGWGLLSFLILLAWVACSTWLARRRQHRTDAAEMNDLGVFLARRYLG